MSAALGICLLAATEVGWAQSEQQQFQAQFTFPPMPNLMMPGEPFLRNADDVRVLEECWETIEERKDAVDSPTYERLRLNVEQAQETVEAVERHAGDHAHQGRRLTSDVEDLKKKVGDFFDRLQQADQRVTEVGSSEEFERHVARFRSEYGNLRRQWDDLSERANRLNARMEKELKPEGERADRAVIRVKEELQEFVKSLPGDRIDIGVAGGVSGIVTANHPWGGAPTRMSPGKTVYHKDKIVTDSSGRMQVLLLDDTVFTIGPDSEIVLDEFIYDPGTQAGSIAASVTKGAFRFVTGKIGRENPGSMKINLPAGGGGIRGTDFITNVRADGKSRIDMLKGRVEFTPTEGGSPALITQGERVNIDSDGTVRDRARIDVAAVEREWEAMIGLKSPEEADDGWLKVSKKQVVFWVLWVGFCGLIFLLDPPLWQGALWCVIGGTAAAIIGAWNMAWKESGGWLAGVLLVLFLFAWFLLDVIHAITDGLASFFRRWLGVVVPAAGWFVMVVATLVTGILIWDVGDGLVYMRRLNHNPDLFWETYRSRGSTLRDLVGCFVLAGVGMLVALVGYWTVRSSRSTRAAPRRRVRGLRQEVRPDRVEEPVETRETLCPVCGKSLAEGRKSRCPKCRETVHRACLSRQVAPGGRLCKRCTGEDPAEGPSRPGGAARGAAS